MSQYYVIYFTVSRKFRAILVIPIHRQNRVLLTNTHHIIHYRRRTSSAAAPSQSRQQQQRKALAWHSPHPSSRSCLKFNVLFWNRDTYANVWVLVYVNARRVLQSSMCIFGEQHTSSHKVFSFTRSHIHTCISSIHCAHSLLCLWWHV